MIRIAFLICALVSMPSQAFATSDRSLILGFLRAVDKGQDLSSLYPGAISRTDANKMQKFADCVPDNPITLKKGEFWIIFVCSQDKMIGAQINISQGKIFNVWTHPVTPTWSKRGR